MQKKNGDDLIRVRVRSFTDSGRTRIGMKRFEAIHAPMVRSIA